MCGHLLIFQFNELYLELFVGNNLAIFVQEFLIILNPLGAYYLHREICECECALIHLFDQCVNLYLMQEIICNIF